MDTKNLTSLDPATLAALANLAGKAAKASRSELSPGKYSVEKIVTLMVDGTVTVSEDETGVVTPQKAKPWSLITVLMQEINTMREAAGMTGMDLAKVVEMAEKVDPKIAQKAEKEANAEIAKIKAGTKSDRKVGCVGPPEGPGPPRREA